MKSKCGSGLVRHYLIINAREEWGSVREERNIPKNKWWNGEVKATVDRKVANVIRSLVNEEGLRHECTMEFPVGILPSSLMYGSEKIQLREKESSDEI